MITGGSPVTWPQKLAAGKSEEQTDADLAAGGDGGLFSRSSPGSLLCGRPSGYSPALPFRLAVAIHR